MFLAVMIGAFMIAVEPGIAVDSTDADSLRPKETNFLLLPIIFSSPDTRLAFGVLPQIVFRTPDSNNPSTLRLDSYYTQNKQYHILLQPTLWFNNNRWNLSGKFSFKKWPTTFYGIGRQASNDFQEKFTETSYDFSTEALTKVGEHYYLGLEYSYRYTDIDPFDENGRLSTGNITGSSGYHVSAPGLLLRMDSRDNLFFPTKGAFHTMSASAAPHWLGSSHPHTTFRLDLRQYVSLSPSQVLAFQTVFESTRGSAPFRMLPAVGSTLRGYSTMRHIDRNLAALQLEYRFVPLLWRLGFVAFAGTGDVFNHAADLNLGELKFSVGLGIRYIFSRSENINIRLDYGFGRDSSADYIDINESF